MADSLVKDIKGDLDKYMKDLSWYVDKEHVVAVMQAALHAEGELKEAISELFTRGKGQLRRNPKATLISDKGKIKSAGAFLDLIYAYVQDEGGTIVPKSGRKLAIPISKKAQKLWPREWPRFQLTFIPRKGRPPLLVEEKGTWKRLGRSGAKEFVVKKMEIHYVLKPSVTIRGKGYVERARKAAEEQIREIVGKHVAEAIKKAPSNQEVA
jgi:hypothetical protein